MSARSSMLALAVVATFGATAIAPTGASAAANHHNSNSHVSPSQTSKYQGSKPISNFKNNKGLIGSDKTTWSPKNNTKVVGKDPNTWTPKKKIVGGDPITWTPKKKIIGGDPITWTPHAWKQHHWFWRYQIVPVETATFVATPAVEAPVVEKVTGPCNCLTKEYLEDGSVALRDICTKEAFLITPGEIQRQAQSPAPQVR